MQATMKQQANGSWELSADYVATAPKRYKQADGRWNPEKKVWTFDAWGYDHIIAYVNSHFADVSIVAYVAPEPAIEQAEGVEPEQTPAEPVAEPTGYASCWKALAASQSSPKRAEYRADDARQTIIALEDDGEVYRTILSQRGRIINEYEEVDGDEAWHHIANWFHAGIFPPLRDIEQRSHNWIAL